MKRLVFVILAVLATSLTIEAATARETFNLEVENTYLEQMMAIQNVATSTYSNTDYLIATFMSENQKRFRTAELVGIRKQLAGLSEQQLMMLSNMNFKNPTVAVVLSVFLGELGIDRFYIGDVGAGIGKLLTMGGLGVWWLVDLFIISNKTKKNNSKDFNEAMILNQVQ